MGKAGDPEWSWGQGRFDKEKNVAVGSYYMNVEIPRLLKSFQVPDSVETRLAAYNWGIGGVHKAYKRLGDKWLSAAPQETKDYIRKYRGSQ
jgi:membrane-bound lytic murein transglycosylase MltF